MQIYSLCILSLVCL
jgi:hypothetical protein